MTAATTLRRQLDLALGKGRPTRRRLARCGRLVQALLLQAPLPEPAAPACPTCRGTDLFASHARPGLHRCRACGTETGGPG